MQATQLDAIKLFMEGGLALADIEANGIQIDTDYLASAIKKVAAEQVDLEQSLKQDPVWDRWKKEFKDPNIHSRTQLASLLFDKMGYRATLFTSGGKTGERKPSAEEEHLKTVDLPFVGKYLQLTKIEKVHNTYLKGIERETDDYGFLHPSFNLVSGMDDKGGGARSYRSSANAPNFQNMPIRNKKQGELIRRCFIPRPGNVLLEVDYSAIEVRIIACQWQDPALVDYVNDSSKDMHRDMAAQCYMLDLTNWPKATYKDARYCAKNLFVFPEFYGSIYFNCATGLWNNIEKMNLVDNDGVDFKTHLKKHGIHELGECEASKKPKPGTFEYHIWKVEQDFWERRFPSCAKSHRKWYKDYQEHGYFDLMTGFRVDNLCRRNQVYNIPIQGAAFHCLLWSLIRLHKFLLKHKCKTRIIGQIHDSLLFDGPRKEIVKLMPIIRKIMTEKIRQAWPWLIVPLEIEADIVNENQSWHEKKPIEI